MLPATIIVPPHHQFGGAPRLVHPAHGTPDTPLRPGAPSRNGPETNLLQPRGLRAYLPYDPISPSFPVRYLSIRLIHARHISPVVRFISSALVPLTLSQGQTNNSDCLKQSCLTRSLSQSMITLTTKVKRHFVHLGRRGGGGEGR